MARRGELPAEIVSLESMVKHLEARRSQHMEHMALGKQENEYRELVGRSKECAHLLELISKRIVQFKHDGV